MQKPDASQAAVAAKQRTAVIDTASGTVVITFPPRMALADIEDWVAHMEILWRTMRRIAPEEEAARG